MVTDPGPASAPAPRSLSLRPLSLRCTGPTKRRALNLYQAPVRPPLPLKEASRYRVSCGRTHLSIRNWRRITDETDGCIDCTCRCYFLFFRRTSFGLDV